jgi:hypothetical protein
MIGKMLSAAVLLVISGVVLAEEYTCSITKVEGDKVTVQKYKKMEKGADFRKAPEKDGDPITLTATKDCKVVKGKYDKEAKKMVAGDPVENGLKNEMFTKISEKGVRATVTVDGSSLTEVMVSQRSRGSFGDFKKKKKDTN